MTRRQVATPKAQDFEDAFYKLPSVAADEAGHVEMTVTVEAWQGPSQITHYDETETVMPILLLKASDEEDDFPTVQNYTMKQEILKANFSYSITIASSQAKVSIPCRAAPNSPRIRRRFLHFCMRMARRRVPLPDVALLHRA